MDWDRIEGNWVQLAGKVQEKWSRLTDDDVQAVAGRREQLAARIQARYGISGAEVEQQLASWQRSATQAWFVRDAPGKR